MLCIQSSPFVDLMSFEVPLILLTAAGMPASQKLRIFLEDFPIITENSRKCNRGYYNIKYAERGAVQTSGTTDSKKQADSA